MVVVVVVRLGWVQSKLLLLMGSEPGKRGGGRRRRETKAESAWWQRMGERGHRDWPGKKGTYSDWMDATGREVRESECVSESERDWHRGGGRCLRGKRGGVCDKTRRGRGGGGGGGGEGGG